MMPYGARAANNVDTDELAEFEAEYVSPNRERPRLSDMALAAERSRASVSYDDIKEELFTLWVEIALRADKLTTIDQIIDRIGVKKSRYAVIEAATGVPWYVVAVVHSLEASLNFECHLHNGDPLSARTVHVPAGRPVAGHPPFAWEESAIDAVRHDGLDGISTWNIERTLYTLERFNGFGYRKYHPEVKTPYLWSFSNHYVRGKYISDGSWSPTAISKQCGAAVLLRRMIDRGFIAEIGSDVGQRFDAAPTAGTPDVDEDLDNEIAEGLDTLGSVTSPEPLDGPRFAEQKTARIGLGDARWPTNPSNAPDTWHLPVEFQDAEFDFTSEVIAAVLATGEFAPDTSTNGRLVISLRGCAIADGSDQKVDASAVRLKAVKPDHENFRCLIGSYDTTTKRLSLYIASTVPRRTGMLKFYNKINFGASGPNCNILPTGCYEHCVGTHGGSGGPVTYVLRLGDGPTSADAGEATVLRTVNDLVYGTRDMWDKTRPADNIHPAFLASSFSSLGCLTIRGTQSQGGSYDSATGEWRKFRQKVGFHGENHGKRFDNLLITGHEAAAIAAGGDLASLSCLRQGSRGERVRRLQSQLGLPVDGVFGAGTCRHLAAIQQQQLGFATGTWSPQMAQLLGMVFG